MSVCIEIPHKSKSVAFAVRLRAKGALLLTVSERGVGIERAGSAIWEFPKIRVPYFGVLIIRILLFRVLY